jgi:hypothetical protein
MLDDQRPNERKVNPELAKIENQLRQMLPTVPRIDRDRLMFDAGRAAQEGLTPDVGTGRFPNKGHWFWPMAASMMTAATLLLATLLAWQNSLSSVAQNATNARPVGTAMHQSHEANSDHPDQLVAEAEHSWRMRSAANGYLGVRYIALTQGAGALETASEATSDGHDSSYDERDVQPATARDLLDKVLPESRRIIRSRS